MTKITLELDDEMTQMLAHYAEPFHEGSMEEAALHLLTLKLVDKFDESGDEVEIDELKNEDCKILLQIWPKLDLVKKIRQKAGEADMPFKEFLNRFLRLEFLAEEEDGTVRAKDLLKLISGPLTIQRLIRSERMCEDIDIDQLSEKTGFSVSDIQTFESGERIPSDEYLLKLSEFTPLSMEMAKMLIARGDPDPTSLEKLCAGKSIKFPAKVWEIEPYFIVECEELGYTTQGTSKIDVLDMLLDCHYCLYADVRASAYFTDETKGEAVIEIFSRKQAEKIKPERSQLI